LLLSLYYAFKAGLALIFDSPAIIFSGMTVILASLALFLLSLGFLCEFAYQNGDFRLAKLVLFSRQPELSERSGDTLTPYSNQDQPSE
jgi:hypothetical protein